MTPEVKRIISELRHKFYLLFAAAMTVPVRITGTSYSSNSPIASWIDNNQRLNYINIYAYTAPDEIIPERPFLVRVAINKSAGIVTMVRQGQGYQGLNQEWDFVLTVMPEEIIDFLPWIVSLVKAQDKGLPTLVHAPPHPIDLKESNMLLSNDLWTQAAWQVAASPISWQIK